MIEVRCIGMRIQGLLARLFAICLLLAPCATALVGQPELESWHLNTDNATGQAWVGNTLVSSDVPCDIQLVQFSEDNVYVEATGIPRYATSPFPSGNPSVASEQDYLFRIPRTPVVNSGAPTETGLGYIGVLVNGVPLFNASDAMSYNNGGVWFQNAVYFENNNFDCARGHPAGGAYHHHQLPMRFDSATEVSSDVCQDHPSDALYTLNTAEHSPLIGWAFDGYPVYGPFAYSTADGSGGVERIETSYQLRDITVRTTLPNGTTLSPFQYGPAVGAWVTPAIPPGASPVQAVLGAYMQDYAYVEGSGHLDEFNGRFAVTPEFPEGTYAYYATVDAEFNSAYPYFFPSYRGVVATDNFPTPGPGGGLGTTSVVITEPVETYVPADPCASQLGDLNGDQLVGVMDVLLMLGEFGCTQSCTHDLNGDGSVTVTDMLILLGAFGQAC